MNKEMTMHFGLEKDPFTKELNCDDILLLPSIKQTCDNLKFLIETKGIGIMTGRPGTGKSSTLRKVIASLHSGTYKVIYICHTSIGVSEFYTHLCAGFGLEKSFRRSAMFRELKEHIITLNKSNRIHPILFIDEAHLLNNEILAEIRLLTNYEIDSYNALTVLLSGQESLNLRFGLKVLESLASSITVNIQVDSLPKEETFSYIEQRISASGATRPLFTKNAMEVISQASGGIMRNINTIANAALFKAFQGTAEQVEAEHVKQVIER